MTGYFNKEKYIAWRVEQDGDEGPILFEILNNTSPWINILDGKYIGSHGNETFLDTEYDISTGKIRNRRVYKVKYREPTTKEIHQAAVRITPGFGGSPSAWLQETKEMFPDTFVMIMDDWCDWREKND